MCNGPVHLSANANATIDAWSPRSSGATTIWPFPVLAVIAAAAVAAAFESGSRTASVTSAPTLANARVVSVPRPEAAPVTTARLPARSTPDNASVVVEDASNGVMSRSISSSLHRCCVEV
jgi:hypothetical protein